ncbi:hypothetical protein BST61_g8255 [Cercospora zeina]
MITIPGKPYTIMAVAMEGRPILISRREISPATLGTLSASCIAPAVPVQTVEYMTQIFWPQFHMHGDDHQAPLLHAYCEKFLFYHYLKYVSAVH